MKVLSALGRLTVLFLSGCAVREPPMQPGTYSTQHDGHELVFELHGEGDEAVVFVHGWAGDRAHWHHQVAGLALGRRVVTLDLLGHGASARPEGDYSLATLADGVAAVCEAAHVDRAVVVGHSNGALVAREFARRHPARCEALVLVDGPLVPTLKPPMIAWMRATLESDDFPSVQRMMAEQMPRGGLSDGDLEILRAGTMRTPQHVHRAGLEILSRPKTFHHDPIRVPLLVVMAEGAQLGEGYEAHVRSLAPQVEYEVWSGVGHAIQLERPLEFNERLELFVRSLGRP